MFSMKTVWTQREICTIWEIFQALSIGNLKNKEKVVQQGPKSEIWVNPGKPRPNLLNRGHQIFVNLSYVVEERVLWITTQTVWKNIAPFWRYLNFFEGTIAKKIHFLWFFCDSHIFTSIHPFDSKFLVKVYLRLNHYPQKIHHSSMVRSW
jgi:hypothetical protein